MFKKFFALFFSLLIVVTSYSATDSIKVSADFERIEKALLEESFRPSFAQLVEQNINLDQFIELRNDGQSKGFSLYIESNRALGLGLYFSKFKLPKTGRVWIENKDGLLLAGPYTHGDNLDGGSFALPLIGNSALFLNYEQDHLDASAELELESVAHAFRDVPFSVANAKREFGDSESCQVNANCSEGGNYITQARAVVRISVRVGQDLFWCTGTIMNNTNQDCKPYILTADHCGEGATATDLDDWVFYFQYESGNCANPSSEGALANKSMTGCVKKANSGGAGDTDSDFYLVELKASIPQFYNPYFAGWNRSVSASPRGVGIHHPSGDLKKISTYTSSATSSSYGGTVSGTHWRVVWVATANGHGVTEGGSSGSPLFNNEKQVVGMLTGGSSACVASPGLGPDMPDYFGKLSYAWESEGSSANKQLKPWLDPMNSGLEKIGGIAWPCLEDSLTGIEEATESKLLLYPNPAKKYLRWNIQNVERALLYGIDGQLIKSFLKPEYIELEEYKRGMYILELQLPNAESYRSKILLQ